MKFRTELIFASLILGVVFLSGCVGQPTTTQTTSQTTTTYTIGVSSSPALGSYLVDSRGMTLYHLTTDTAGTQPVSNCLGNCRAIWPVFYTQNIVAQSSLNASDFTAFTRSDGAQQLAYKGMPLYYYSGDQKPGDTNGQGIQNIWFVVSPSGTSTTASTTSSTSSVTSSTTSSSTTSSYYPPY